MVVKTGTYIGDGNATQAIVGVGFTPKIVSIIRQLDGETGSNDCGKITSDGLASSIQYSNNIDNLVAVDYIISLDANGFTVGSDAGVHFHGNMLNILGNTYSYICWS